MKKQLEYSEFSFGYAFTENLIRSSAIGADECASFPEPRGGRHAGLRRRNRRWRRPGFLSVQAAGTHGVAERGGDLEAWARQARIAYTVLQDVPDDEGVVAAA